MAVVEFAAIREAAVAKLADAVVFVTCGAPALVFSDQAVLHVVFIGKRPMAVVNVYEATQSVVAIVNLFAIRKGLNQQTAGGIR